MTDKFVVSTNEIGEIIVTDTETGKVYHYGSMSNFLGLIRLLNEQQEWIEELQVSDEMGWNRAEHFEKKCPKELHNKKMYIKRLEYKVQKFKEENEQLKSDIILIEKNADRHYEENKQLNAFLVHKGVAEEYMQWKREGEQFEENIYTPSKKPMRLVGGKPLFKWKR